jgi:hypothetical protein
MFQYPALQKQDVLSAAEVEFDGHSRQKEAPLTSE